MAFGLSAGTIGLISAGVGAAGSLLGGSKQSGTQTSTTQQQLDPRIQAMLFGDGTSGNTGLLAQYQALGQAPQSDPSKAWANTNANYLTQNGAGDLNSIRNSAQSLMGGSAAPSFGAAQVGTAQATVPSYATGNMVDAPSQNNINLSPTFQSLLAGGDTTKLTDSLKAGNALAGAQFQQNQSDLTDNLQRNVLPGIRGGAIAAGQYGGSRQGIAEGLAISDLTKQVNNSNTQFGLGATAANSAAMAANYENGQNRALSAAQGLSAQQYGVAQQNAATKNAAEFMNVGNQLDISKTNAGLAQQSMLANQSSANGANLANQQAQLTTNAQNNASGLAGAGLLGGLLGQAGNSVNAQDNYNLTKAQNMNSLLAPYLSANQSTTSTTPQYSNTAGNLLGGASAGLGLFNSLNKLF